MVAFNKGKTMHFYSILYKNKKISIVALIPHKETGLYSFVNMTKGHICPCQFKTIEEALEDLKSYQNIEFWEEIQW
jgi:hypothetical protein